VKRARGQFRKRVDATAERHCKRRDLDAALRERRVVFEGGVCGAFSERDGANRAAPEFDFGEGGHGVSPQRHGWAGGLGALRGDEARWRRLPRSLSCAIGPGTGSGPNRTGRPEDESPRRARVSFTVGASWRIAFSNRVMPLPCSAEPMNTGQILPARMGDVAGERPRLFSRVVRADVDVDRCVEIVGVCRGLRSLTPLFVKRVTVQVGKQLDGPTHGRRFAGSGIDVEISLDVYQRVRVPGKPAESAVVHDRRQHDVLQVVLARSSPSVEARKADGRRREAEADATKYEHHDEIDASESASLKRLIGLHVYLLSDVIR